ncbi:unnamed protein product, partial [Hapterophycus canaliculatus]
GWRDSPTEVASMRAALFGAGGSPGMVQELRAAYSFLLARFNAMHGAGAGAGDSSSGGDRGGGGGGGGGGASRSGGGNGDAGAPGDIIVRPWDALCDAMESSVAASPSELKPPAAAVLRCRPLLDPNARMPSYPILAPARLLRNGSLDVRLPADGVRARQDRAAMTLHGVVRRNLSASSCGKIAVAEAQKVLIVDPVGALALRYATATAAAGSGGGSGGGSGSMAASRGSTAATPAAAQGSRSTSSALTSPADMPVDRSHLCVLSSMAVGFDVVGVAFNPANERHLVVWGLRQCCVIVLNSRGVALRRVQVNLSFGAFASAGGGGDGGRNGGGGEDCSTCVLKACWVPGSQVLLAAVCTQFIRVYDLSADAAAPLHTFYLPATAEDASGDGVGSCIRDVVLFPAKPAPAALSLQASASGSAPPEPAGWESGAGAPTLLATAVVLTGAGRLYAKGIPAPASSEPLEGTGGSDGGGGGGGGLAGFAHDGEIRHRLMIPPLLEEEARSAGTGDDGGSGPGRTGGGGGGGGGDGSNSSESGAGGRGCRSESVGGASADTGGGSGQDDEEVESPVSGMDSPSSPSYLYLSAFAGCDFDDVVSDSPDESLIFAEPGLRRRGWAGSSAAASSSSAAAAVSAADAVLAMSPVRLARASAEAQETAAASFGALHFSSPTGLLVVARGGKST